MMGHRLVAEQHNGVGDGAEPVHDGPDEGEGGQVEHGVLGGGDFLAVQDSADIMINAVLYNKGVLKLLVR